MAFKSVLLLVAACAAVCAAQRAQVHHPLLLTPLRNIANNIETDLVEAFQNLDDIREVVNVVALEASNRGQDAEVIIACFRAQKDLYYSIGKRIQQLLRQASDDLSADLGDKYEEFAKKISGPMRNIGEIMKTLPQKMWVLIQNQEFGKAMELMRASRRVFEENARMIYRTIGELRAEMPQVAEKAYRWAAKIREESGKGMHMLRESFHKCVQEGGPKKPADSE